MICWVLPPQFGHKWNPVYQRFCVNMERQRGFVKALQQLPDFQEYTLVCALLHMPTAQLYSMLACALPTHLLCWL